jgi:hypothetical protein
VKNEERIYVTSVPSPTTFTYATSKGGKSDPADRATGGFIRALHYGYTTPTPEGINVFSGNAPELHTLKNFVISGNVIRPYSNFGKNRIPSLGIRVCGAENGRIFNNTVFDSGNHCGLIVASTKQFKSSVICRENYNIDNTPALPRDDKGNLVAGGRPGLPSLAGGLRLSHAVDTAGPAGDHHFAGKPGDYAVGADFLYLYTGDGAKHLWKRIAMGDY